MCGCAAWRARRAARAARRAAMRSSGCRCRGFVGPVEVAVPGARLGEHPMSRPAAASVPAKCSPETRSSSTSPLIMSVGGKCARSSAVASPGIAGERGPVDRPAEVVLVHLHARRRVRTCRPRGRRRARPAARHPARAARRAASGRRARRASGRGPTSASSRRVAPVTRLAPALAPPIAHGPGRRAPTRAPSGTRRRCRRMPPGSARRPSRSHRAARPSAAAAVRASSRPTPP